MVVSAMALAMLAGGADLSATQAATLQKASAAREVYVCDASEQTRRAWERQYGEMKFVTAKQAMRAGETWSAPRCMTASEHQKLMDLQAKSAGRTTYASR